MNGPFPRLTLLVAAAALLVFVSGDLAAILQYDRNAIMSGELWRLLTGHLVHFSLPHLGFDLLAFAVAGWGIERRGYPLFGWLLAGSAFAISFAMFLWLPPLRVYGGLSGIVFAALFYLALWEIASDGAWRYTAVFVAIVLAGKVALEFYSGSSFLMQLRKEDFVPVPLSHAVGMATAFALFAGGWLGKRRKVKGASVKEASARGKRISPGLPGR